MCVSLFDTHIDYTVSNIDTIVKWNYLRYNTEYEEEAIVIRVHVKLTELLEERGISQRELARKTDIRHMTINQMCTNSVKHIPLDNLAKICEVLHCQITDILVLVPEE